MSSSKYHRHLLATSIAAAAALFSARAQAQSAESGELAQLVPAGTLVYVQAPSIDRLTDAARQIVGAFNPRAVAALDAEALVADLGLPGGLAHVDRTRPFAVCLTFPDAPEGEPQPTFLVPVTSAEEFVGSLTELGAPFKTAIAGTYVAVSPAHEAQRGAGANPIALGLPPGELVVRLDLESLVDHFRPVIDAGLAEMEAEISDTPNLGLPGGDAGPMMEMYFDGARAFVDSADVLDLALRLDGSRLEIASALSTLPNSVLASFASKEKSGAAELARCLDPEAPVAIVFGGDMAALAKRFQPFLAACLDIYPEPMRASFAGMMGNMHELAALTGTAIAASGDLTESGMRFAYALRPREPKKLLAAYVAMMRSVPGIVFAGPTETETDGVQVTRVRMKIDPQTFASAQEASVRPEQQEQLERMIETLYGKDGLQLAFATKGDLMTMVLGGDDAFVQRSIARLSGGGGVAPEMKKRLEQVAPLSPCFAAHYDVGSMMRWAQALTPQGAGAAFIPRLAGTFTFWGGVDALVWRGGMSFDLEELGSSVRAMTGQHVAVAYVGKAKADITQIAMALDEYAINNAGGFPENLRVLVTPDVNGHTYLKKRSIPKDPWGNDYRYDPPRSGQAAPRVYSLGKDNRPGGAGEDADIDSLTMTEQK